MGDTCKKSQSFTVAKQGSAKYKKNYINPLFVLRQCNVMNNKTFMINQILHSY